MQVFRKTERGQQQGRIAFEVAGLKWLAEAGPEACKVAPVLDWGQEGSTAWLEEPVIPSVTPTPEAAFKFGQGLAHMHAAGASHWGAPPGEFTGEGAMGRSGLKLLTKEESPESWGEFYARYRIEPYLDESPFSITERDVIKRFCDLLYSGALDHPQPALVTTKAARIHGDLWNGNVIWGEEGAVLIDPAANGGHAEEDLGTLALFNAPHLQQIFYGYQQESPCAAGWPDRLALHQMHMLTVHCYLFGARYVKQTVQIARRYLSKTRPESQRIR